MSKTDEQLAVAYCEENYLPYSQDGEMRGDYFDAFIDGLREGRRLERERAAKILAELPINQFFNSKRRGDQSTAYTLDWVKKNKSSTHPKKARRHDRL